MLASLNQHCMGDQGQDRWELCTSVHLHETLIFSAEFQNCTNYDLHAVSDQTYCLNPILETVQVAVSHHGLLPPVWQALDCTHAHDGSCLFLTKDTGPSRAAVQVAHFLVCSSRSSGFDWQPVPQVQPAELREVQLRLR